MSYPVPLPAVKIIAAAVALVIAFLVGWTVNGWRMSTQMAELEGSYARAEVEAANAAIADLQKATGTIAKAAEEYGKITTDTSSKINLLRREVRQYVKEHPLPADCKPDAYRVRKLSTSIEAANQAISGR